MTTVPEATLAAELGLSYAALALPTDYDSWRESGDHVSVEKVLMVLKKNGEVAKHVIMRTVELLKDSDWSGRVEERRKRAANSVIS